MPSSASLRRRLVDGLAIADERVRDAFLRVPRERFLPGVPLEEVYRDDAIVTKRDERGLPLSSSSQPQIMATMLELLDLRPGLRVLEIGAGTGYNAALLKTLVGPRGRVVSVDVDAELARSARLALRKDGHAVRVVCRDGRDGHAAAAPYDRIVATVSTGELPRAWRDQLAGDGLLELPLSLARGEQVVATFRREGERLRSTAAVGGGFIPLRGTAPPGRPTLRAEESGLDAPDGPLAELGGPGIAVLSAAARRRLLALALGMPRRVPLGGALPRWSLRLWLALDLPDARFVESPHTGVGVAGRGGRSLALADTGRHGPSTPATRHLLAWGEPDAERYLRRSVDRWRARGCPGPAELELEVSFRGSRSTVARRWRRR